MLMSHVPGALRGDVDDAHRTRVAARRLAEVLPLLRGRKAERLHADVRQLRQVLGARRELAVALALLDEEAGRWHWAAPLVGRIRRHLEESRASIEAATEEAARAVDVPRLGRRLTRAAELAAAEPYPELIARLRRRRASRELALVRAVAAAGALYDVERLHQIRIATKKLRYVLEAQIECAGRGPVARIRALKVLQAELGRLHDLQVLERAVRDVEGRFVSGRGRVARGLARVGADLETECRRLHALVLTAIRRATHGNTLAVSGAARNRRRARR